jgi:phosphoglycolate phosphatase
LTKAFFTTRTADDCPSKPHPAMVLECCAEAGIDPERTTVIGDAIYDMQMAASAGASGIGVSWGYGAVDALKSAAGAHHMVHRADEIADLSDPPVLTKTRRRASCVTF